MKALEARKKKRRSHKVQVIVSGVRRNTASNVRRVVSRMEGVLNAVKASWLGQNEMDAHVDACCAGANWRLMERAGETCAVTPFLDSCDVTEDVAVAKCGTAWVSDVNG